MGGWWEELALCPKHAISLPISVWQSNTLSMAAVYQQSGSDGWAGEPEEDEEQERRYDRRIGERVERFAQRQEDGGWCSCGCCFPTENPLSEADLTCCQESDAARDLCSGHAEFGDAHPYRCVTHHPSFYTLCKYERELRNISHVYRRAGHDVRGRADNQQLRYTAYCQYTVWAHGRLGRKNRRRIPHCVLQDIRRRFPAGDAREYTGYESASTDSDQ